MKQEESKKKSKLWLWLVIALVALLAVVGVVLALVLGGNSEPTGPQGGRPELYWNVDRKAYTENSETGLSTREPGEDGLFHVRFAINGELVEYPVADKQLINFIDTLDALGLVLDESGTVVDVKDPKEIATEINKNAYVKAVTGDMITANTSIAMNGMNVTVKLEDVTEIYDVTPEAEVPGQIIQVSDLLPMDTLCIYANDMEQVTHIYVTSHGKQSKVYWRAEQQYDSKLKETARVPDENGAYSIDFFCEGERITLKTKDKTIATKIDSVSRWKCHFGFTFDEEGYIIEQFASALGIGGITVADCWDIVAIDGEYVTIQRLTTNDGSIWEGTIPADCVIYDASYAAMSEKRQGKQVDSLQMGDRVTVWTDTTGTPVLVYVSNRLVDSPAYWVPSRKYDSKLKETKREIGPSGYYEVELVPEGGPKQTYYIKDKETMSYLDSISQKCVGIKADENRVVEYVYHFEALTGYTCATQGGCVTTVTGSIFTKITIGKPDTTVNLVLAANARVYNVSTYGEMGAETTIQPGDHVYGYRQPTGEILVAFVTRREMGADHMYWRLQAMYDKENKVTTREPDADGWYYIDFAYMGKQVTLKTRDKSIVTKIDALSIGATALEVSGDVIVKVHDATYAYSGQKVASGYRYRYVTEEGLYHCVYNSDSTKTVEFKMADDCVIYNVSPIFEKYQGERIYSIPYNAMLTVFCDIYGEAKVVYVRAQDVDNMYWKTETLYDSTNLVTKREPDADGYYWYTLAVNGECKKFKTKDQAIANSMDSYAGAFGLNVKGDEILAFVSTSNVKGVKGNGVNGYCVTAINGRKVTLTYNKPGSSFGKTQTITLSSDAKIYDVTPDSATFGAAIELKVGDTVRTYMSREGETHNYVYVMAHSTRKGGETGWCEVCKKNVTWNPLVNSVNMSKADGHWYVTQDMTSYVQQTHASTSKDYTVCLDLNGHTLTRSENGRMFRIAEGETLNIMDSVGGGKIVTGGGKGYNGGMILMSTGGKVNLYGGTLEFVQGEIKNANGGIVYMSGKETVFNMYGGTVTGGHAYAKDGKPAYGGNFHISSAATLNMYGGEILGGKVYGMLYESVSSKTGKTTYTAVAPYGGNIAMTESSMVNIYGGVVKDGEAVRETFKYTVDGVEKSVSNISYGGNIYKISTNKLNGKLYIENATVSGGHAHRGGNINVFASSGGSAGIVELKNATVIDGTATQFGGNIMSNCAQWTISGGTKILNGACTNDNGRTGCGGNIYSQGGEYTVEDATISGGQAGSGGNVYLYKNKYDTNVFTVKDGTVIENGIATTYGGNIYVKGKNYEEFEGKVYEHDEVEGTPLLPTLNVEGGEILGGKCDTEATTKYIGGNIYSAGNMNLTGGRIAGGLQGDAEYDIYVAGGGEGDVTVSNVQVEGKFRVNGPKSFVLSGAPKLGQLNIYSRVTVEVGEMTENADIKVVAYASSPVFTKPFDNAQAYVDAGYFTSYDESKSIIVTADSELSVDVPKIIKWCDHCMQDVQWYEYDINASGGSLTGEGVHYYIPEGGYVQNAQYTIKGDIIVDLNGQTLTGAESKRLWLVYGTLSVIDSVGGGKAETKCNPAGSGGLALISKDSSGNIGTLNLYSGTLTVADGHVQSTAGGILTMSSGSTFNMYGGSIYGGDTNGVGKNINFSGSNGNISGGTIDGGVYVSSSSQLTVSGTAKIAKANDGVDLSSGALLKVGTMDDTAEVYVSGNAGAITEALTDADSYLDNIKAAGEGWSVANVDGVLTLKDSNAPFEPNAVHTQAADMEFTTTDPDGKVTATCPVCRESVDWYPLDPADADHCTGSSATTKKVELAAGHYYLSGDKDYTNNVGYYSVTGGVQVCINLNGQSIVSSTRSFFTESETTVLNIMGEGTVTGAGYQSGSAYRAHMDGTAAINLYGGTYVSSNEIAVVNMRSGLNPKCVLNMYEGTTIQADASEYALYVSGKSSAINIYGGTVIGGSVYADKETAILSVSGAPVISEVELANGALLTVGELTAGADITVTADGVFTNDLADAEAVKGYFTSGVADKEVIVEGSALAIGTAPAGTEPDAPSIYEQAKAMDFTAGGTVNAVCPVCGTAQDWTALEAAGTSRVNINDGEHHHYYLDPNVDYTQAANFYYIKSATQVCLNLNGQNMASSARVFMTESEGTVLNIMGDGTVTGGASSFMSNGNYSGAALDATAPINLYGGTFTGSTEYPVLANRGSKTYSIVNIYEGTKIVRTENGAQGPLVMVQDNGTVNMYGGEISGGTAIEVESIGTGLKYGGNVLVKASTNTNKNYAYTATFNMYGGVIADGTAETKGGNIAAVCLDLSNPKAIVNISGGEVKGGSVAAVGTNASINISGNPIVDYLEMEGTSLVNVADMTEGASVKVSVAENVPFTSEIASNADTYAQYFYGEGENLKAIVKNNALVIAEVCPHCNVEMSAIDWQPIELSSGMVIEQGGHFYLDKSYEGFTSQMAVKGSEIDVVIDLKGQTITTSGRGFYVGSEKEDIGSSLSLLDSVGTGGITSTYKNGGGVLYVYTKINTKTNTLNIYGGTYSNVANPTNGGCLYNRTSNLNVYGGTFNGANIQSGKQGGTVYANGGVTNIYGGTLNAGSSDGQGDCIYIKPYSDTIGASLNISGGIVTGQSLIAEGVEISVEGAPVIGTLELGTDVKLTLGELTEGAEITVTADGEFAEGENAQAYVDAGYIKAAEGKKITSEGNVLSMSNETVLQKLAAFFRALCASII